MFVLAFAQGIIWTLVEFLYNFYTNQFVRINYHNLSRYLTLSYKFPNCSQDIDMFQAFDFLIAKDPEAFHNARASSLRDTV